MTLTPRLMSKFWTPATRTKSRSTANEKAPSFTLSERRTELLTIAEQADTLRGTHNPETGEADMSIEFFVQCDDPKEAKFKELVEFVDFAGLEREPNAGSKMFPDWHEGELVFNVYNTRRNVQIMVMLCEEHGFNIVRIA
jgi:hypothetical protein